MFEVCVSGLYWSTIVLSSCMHGDVPSAEDRVDFKLVVMINSGKNYNSNTAHIACLIVLIGIIVVECKLTTVQAPLVIGGVASNGLCYAAKPWSIHKNGDRPEHGVSNHRRLDCLLSRL